MRSLALFAIALFLVGCGSSGSDTIPRPESNTASKDSAGSSSSAANPESPTASDAAPSTQTPATDGAKVDDHAGHDHGPGEGHGSEKPKTGVALASKDVEGKWSGSGESPNGKEAYELEIKSNMELEMTVTPSGGSPGTFQGKWEIDQDAVLMHLLKATINGDSRDIHTDLVWKVEGGQLVLQTGPAAGKVKLSRKG